MLLANFSAEINYTTKELGVAKMLSDDGLNLVGPESGADTSWAEVSWEKISDFTRQTSCSSTIPRLTTRTIPSSRAFSQSNTNNSAPGTTTSYTYDGYTQWLGELADVLEAAKDIQKD